MENEKEILWRCSQDLAETWKRFYGLGTYYEGYLTPQMVKEIMSVRRYGGNYADLQIKDDVKEKLVAVAERYDLSEAVIGEETWNAFLDYINNKQN